MFGTILVDCTALAKDMKTKDYRPDLVAVQRQVRDYKRYFASL